LSNNSRKLLRFEITKMLIACSLKINLLCYLLQFSAYFRSLYIPSFVIIGRVVSRLWQVEICPDPLTVLSIGLNPTYSLAITLPMSPWRGHKNYNGDIYYKVFGRGEGTRSTECRPAVFRTGCWFSIFTECTDPPQPTEREREREWEKQRWDEARWKETRLSDFRECHPYTNVSCMQLCHSPANSYLRPLHCLPIVYMQTPCTVWIYTVSQKNKTLNSCT